MGRDPNRSIIIIDSSTLINLILNCLNFYYDGIDDKRPEVVAEKVKEFRKTVRDYIFPEYHFRTRRVGVHHLEEADKLKALDFGFKGPIYTDEEGDLFDQNNSLLNLLFEVYHA
jgi:hypothetical protein